MTRCTCSKDWETCPMHQWERGFSSIAAQEQENAQRALRLKQKRFNNKHHKDERKQRF